MKKLLSILAFSTLIAAEMPPMSYQDNQKIAFQNSILCKVNGNTISMMDVKKKMDVIFHQNYAHLENSSQARFQFYEGSWRHILAEMVDNELILSDATDKEIKLTDGEVREELESRFGPSVMITLDEIGVTYDEAWKMVKNDLIVRRMMWWFIHARALQKVTPQDIRQAYRAHLKDNPPYKEHKYRVIAVRGDNPEAASQKIHQYLLENKESPEFLATELKAIEPSIQISSEYSAKDAELSEVYRTVLSSLSPGEYSLPVVQISRSEKQAVGRIFYLADATNFEAPQFEEISTVLQNELNQRAVAGESIAYLEKLRKHYGFDEKHLKETLPDGFHPFSLE